MILCDFLSRIKSDDTDPDNLIPIAFHQMELKQFNTILRKSSISFMDWTNWDTN